MIRTERRTPTPTNIGFAGENTCHICECRSRTNSSPEAYQANTLSKGVRESIEHIDCWDEPLGPSIIAISGLI